MMAITVAGRDVDAFKRGFTSKMLAAIDAEGGNSPYHSMRCAMPTGCVTAAATTRPGRTGLCRGVCPLQANSVRIKPVKLLIADRDIRVLDAQTGELIRQLTLDPSRDYQPIGGG